MRFEIFSICAVCSLNCKPGLRQQELLLKGVNNLDFLITIIINTQERIIV